jgi:hypothetical protein
VTPTLALALAHIAPQYNAREHARAAERMVEDMKTKTETWPKYVAERHPRGPTNNAGWIVARRFEDGTSEVVADTDGNWLWSNKSSAHAFIEELQDNAK